MGYEREQVRLLKELLEVDKEILRVLRLSIPPTPPLPTAITFRQVDVP